MKTKPLLALGPMAGFTNAPFRKLCVENGANLTVTEMVSAMGLLHAPKEKDIYGKLLFVNDNEKCVGAQIFGNDPKVCAKATKCIADMQKFHFIDINMGCPVKKIVGNGEGSALMKTPKLAGEIVESVALASDLPVHVKMRIGWDSDHINAVDFAKVLECSGAKMIAVHGRTREQFYSGKANWEEIAKVKQAVKVPVIANGDVNSGQTAKDILYATQCDGLMVARASMGNPWIFKEIQCFLNGNSFLPPTKEEMKQCLLKHFQTLIDFEGEHRGLAESKSQLVHYFFGLPSASLARQRFNMAQSVDDVLKLIDEFFEA